MRSRMKPRHKGITDRKNFEPPFTLSFDQDIIRRLNSKMGNGSAAQTKPAETSPRSRLFGRGSRPMSRWSSSSTVGTDYTFHQLAPYIGRIKTSIARWLVQTWTQDGDTVVDPFCGAGT